VLSDLDGLRDDPFHVNQDFEGETERDVISPALTFVHTGEDLELTSITAYQDWRILETPDFDFSPFDAVVRRTSESQRYWVEELRLATLEDAPMRVADDMDLRWQLGVLGFVSDANRSAQNDFRPLSGMTGVDTNRGDFDDWGVGVFGQATVTFSERLDVTGGVRYDHESKELENRHTFAVGGTTVLDESADFDEDFDEVLPMGSLAYHFTEELLVYGLAARGFKAGGFNLTAPAGRQSFEAETNWTYEVGVKKSFGDRARIGLAAFYIDWDDMQLSLFDATAGGYVANAGESTSKGVEVEGEVTVYDGWTVFTGFGFTDTEFDEFTDPFGTDVSGNDLPFAPETLWNVGSEYRHRFGREGHWFVRGALTDVGEFFYDAGNLEDESYQLVDFSAGVRQRRWDLDFWIRNAFDEEYVSVAFQPNPFDPTAFVGENGPPQTFGFTLNVYL
jgi:iron complex outermembrane receptor protein